MANAKINKLTNAAIYLNGNGLLGRAAEIDLPQPTYKMVDHTALGMFGTAQLPAGLEALEMRIKWTSYYADANALTTNPFSSLNLQLRGNLETYDSNGRTAQVPYVCFVTCTPKDNQLGNFKPHEDAEFETNFTCTQVKLEVDGQAKYEVDVMANIFKVNGVDVLGTYRANLGI